MKGILIIAFFFLAGCSSLASLDELEAQAMLSGDWTEVEKRERIIARRKLRSGIACPPGTTGYCETSFGQEECMCVKSEIISASFRQ